MHEYVDRLTESTHVDAPPAPTTIEMLPRGETIVAPMAVEPIAPITNSEGVHQ